MAKYFEEIVDNAVKGLLEVNDYDYKQIDELNVDTSCYLSPRATGVLSGIDTALAIFKKIDNKISYKILKLDGSYVNRGDVIAVIKGPLYSILKGEKLVLNYLCYASGIASNTRKYINELSGCDAIISYYESSNPILQQLSKDAFSKGGGDVSEKKMFFINNHVLCMFKNVEECIKAFRKNDKSLRLCLEVCTKEEFEEAYVANVANIRLSTNKLDLIKECLYINNGKKNIELCSDIDYKKIRGLYKEGIKKFVIPSLTIDSAYLPISLLFYKR